MLPTRISMPRRDDGYYEFISRDIILASAYFKTLLTVKAGTSLPRATPAVLAGASAIWYARSNRLPPMRKRHDMMRAEPCCRADA